MHDIFKALKGRNKRIAELKQENKFLTSCLQSANNTAEIYRKRYDDEKEKLDSMRDEIRALCEMAKHNSAATYDRMTGVLNEIIEETFDGAAVV